jgi:hypothetical protein
MAVGDFDGDNHLDVAIAGTRDFVNMVVVYFGNGDGTPRFSQNYPVGASCAAMATADFNDDDVADLAVVMGSSGMVSVLLGSSQGDLGPIRNYGVGTSPSDIALGDFNGDGLLDMAVTNYGSNNVSVLLGNGDGTFGTARNFAVRESPTSLHVTDLDGDGIADLLVISRSVFSGWLSILIGIGDGTFRLERSVPIEAGGSPSILEDVNGDGWPDLIVASSYSVAVLLGRADGTFAPAQYFGVGAPTGFLAAGDFNRDGRPDLAVISADVIFSAVTILINNTPRP